MIRIEEIATESGTQYRLSDGQSLIPFDLDSVAKKRKKSFREIREKIGVSARTLRRLRDLRLATDDIRSYLIEPKYYDINIVHKNGPTIVYRAYPHNDHTGSRYFILWRAPGLPTWKVKKSEYDNSLYCNCSTFAESKYGNFNNCNHTEAIRKAKLM